MSWVPDVVAILRAIPEIVWGGLLTLATVIVTEGRNTKRAREQREHDAVEKDKERTMTLRREIYFPVASEFTAVMSFIGSLPSYSIEVIGKGEPLRGYGAVASKLALVASPETALVVHRLSTEASALYIAMAPRALAIAQTRNQIEVHDRLQQTQLAEMERLNGAMAAIQESGMRDDARFNALHIRYQSVRALFDSQGVERDDLARQQEQAFKDFGHQLLPRLRPLLDVSISVMAALRHDLGQDGAVADLERQMKRQSEKVYAELEAALGPDQVSSMNS